MLLEGVLTLRIQLIQDHFGDNCLNVGSAGLNSHA